MTSIRTTLTTPKPVTATEDDAFQALVGRLSAQSLVKRHDAYTDIDWDHPDHTFEPGDPRVRLWSFDPLRRTDWYQSLSPEQQSDVGIHRIASNMRIGLEFENMLQRGLLDFALRLPQGAPEFRYVLHEVIEETQHTMMFQELANRAGVDAGTMPRSLQFLCAKFVLPLAWQFPEFFFVFVLGGEEPIDHIQRVSVKHVEHPLVERVMQIHIAEEARHIGFARNFMVKRVPKLGRVRRRILADLTPVVLGIMAPLMVYPSAKTLRTFDAPSSVRKQMKADLETKQLLKDSVRKIRNLCAELGLIDRRSRRLWKLAGLWDDPTS